MFLPQQVIKKFIIFELITKTTPRPERKLSQYFEGSGRRKKNISSYEEKSKFNTWKKHRSLKPEDSAAFVESIPLGLQSLVPLLLYSPVRRPEATHKDLKISQTVV